MDIDFVLSRGRRDEILKALMAIHRQVGNLHKTAPTGAFDSRGVVIQTNVSIIRACLTNLPWVDGAASETESA